MSLARHSSSTSTIVDGVGASLPASLPASALPPTIYTATYSGVKVYEMVVNGVSVMRRKHDSSLNATQILKVAGVEKSKRTKVLEREVLTGEHEKVQGGYGKYQGTWIPFERGIELCRNYGVLEILDPLLSFHESDSTPSKEQAVVSRKRQRASLIQNFSQVSASSQALQSIQDSGVRTSSSQLLPAITDFQEEPTPALNNNKRLSLTGEQRPDIPASSLTQHIGLNASKAIASLEHNVPTYPPPGAPPALYEEYKPQQDGPIDTSLIPDTNQPLPTLTPETCENFEPSHDVVMDIFTSEHMSIPQNLSHVNFDVPIDEMGNTALHWAAALGNTKLVKDLLDKGAKVCRGNYAGETPLIRSVLVTNNSDSSRFADLLELLYPSIVIQDYTQRNVLHHIALTSGIKGRGGSSSYYMATLLEWLVRRGQGRLGFRKFVGEIVNARDSRGDTALNIASKTNSSHIANQLLDIGADEHIANRAGLRPADFGYKRNQSNEENGEDQEMTDGVDQVSASPTRTNDAMTSQFLKRQKLMSELEGFLQEAETEFKTEITSKGKAIKDLTEQLRKAHQTLRDEKERLNQLKQLQTRQVELRRSVQNLDRAIADEDTRYKTTSDEPISDVVENMDPDQPFRVTADQKLSHKVIQARVAAYKHDVENLRRLASVLKERSTSQELKFRAVVSRCTGVAEEKVEELLPALLQAVGSDPPEVDMTRISTFLRKIDH